MSDSGISFFSLKSATYSDSHQYDASPITWVKNFPSILKNRLVLQLPLSTSHPTLRSFPERRRFLSSFEIWPEKTLNISSVWVLSSQNLGKFTLVYGLVSNGVSAGRPNATLVKKGNFLMYRCLVILTSPPKRGPVDVDDMGITGLIAREILLSGYPYWDFFFTMTPE